MKRIKWSAIMATLMVLAILIPSGWAETPPPPAAQGAAGSGTAAGLSGATVAGIVAGALVVVGITAEALSSGGNSPTSTHHAMTSDHPR